MSYEIMFDGTRHEMEAQARQSCIDYLGSEQRFEQLIWNIRKDLRLDPRFKHLSTASKYRLIKRSLGMFVGIAGRYPVRAIAREALK